MAKYRKKPIVIEAIQWFKHGDHDAVRKHDTNPKNGWVDFPGVSLAIWPGCWILEEDGRPTNIMMDDNFKSLYEPVALTGPITESPQMYGSIPVKPKGQDPPTGYC